MKHGNIVLLNGTASAGKTRIAQALQEIMDRPYLHTGIDHFLEGLPSRAFTHSDGVKPATADGWLLVFRDGVLAEPPKIGPAGHRFLSGMYQALAAFARAGNDVIVDDAIYDRRVLAAAAGALADLDALFVGVHGPRPEVERREKAQSDRAGGTSLFYDLVHAHGLYDLEVDTSHLSPQECAAQIKQALQADQPRTALRKLRRRRAGEG